MNTADVIRELEPYAPRQIRVLCPRRHVIANMRLSVIDGQLTTRRERSARDLNRRREQRKPALYADLHVSSDRNTVLECGNSHCRYRGNRNEMELALELAKAALRQRLDGVQHAEYQLTS
jgi:hypothetical protein